MKCVFIYFTKRLLIINQSMNQSEENLKPKEMIVNCLSQINVL